MEAVAVLAAQIWPILLSLAAWGAALAAVHAVVSEAEAQGADLEEALVVVSAVAALVAAAPEEAGKTQSLYIKKHPPLAGVFMF